MAYKLNPDFPLLWRDLSTLQLGYDSALSVFRNLSNTHAQILEGLKTGLSLGGIQMMAARGKIAPAELEDFIRSLSPALLFDGDLLPKVLPEVLEEPVKPRRFSVSIEGPSRLCERVWGLLHSEQGIWPGVGYESSEDLSNPEEKNVRPLVILVARFISLPEHSQKHLQNETLHLPVVFGDQGVRIGPLIQPGIGPCNYCLYLWKEEEQPWLATTSTQTLGLCAASEHGTLFLRAIAELRVQLDRIHSEGFSDRHESIRILRNGEISKQEWFPHPECYCCRPDFAENEMEFGSHHNDFASNSSAAVTV